MRSCLAVTTISDLLGHRGLLRCVVWAMLASWYWSAPFFSASASASFGQLADLVWSHVWCFIGQRYNIQKVRWRHLWVHSFEWSGTSMHARVKGARPSSLSQAHRWKAHCVAVCCGGARSSQATIIFQNKKLWKKCLGVCADVTFHGLNWSCTEKVFQLKLNSIRYFFATVCELCV